MSEETTSSLSQRVARLERDNRRLRRLGGTALVGLLALLVMGHGEPAVKRVEGDQIALQAPGGMIRGEMSLGGDGSVRFVLYDRARTPRLELLSGLPDGAPALTLYDRRWASRASLRLEDDGTPRLELYDKDGKKIWAAP